MSIGKEPYAGMWDWDGACAPRPGRGAYGQETFSVGCFQWLPMSRGKGLKRGKVAYRVKGRVSEADAVFAAATAYCAKRNAREAAA